VHALGRERQKAVTKANVVELASRRRASVLGDLAENGDTPPDPDDYAVVVGDRAHRIVGRVLNAGPLPTDRIARASVLLAAGRDTLAEHPAHFRERAVLSQAVGSAAAYLHWFAPEPPWALLGAEVPAGGGSIDLVFTHPDGTVVADEMKFGLSRATETALRPQVDRYLEAGATEWGAAFAGVRLCAVGAPRTSRFYPVGKKRSLLLAETPWWRLGGETR
jgi:hypothetical protein